MSENWTIHHDRRASVEAVRLLGLTFTWGGTNCAYKFVPTEHGDVVRVRDVTGRMYDGKWFTVREGETDAFARELEQHYGEVHLVTLHDEVPEHV